MVSIKVDERILTCEQEGKGTMSKYNDNCHVYGPKNIHKMSHVHILYEYPYTESYLNDPKLYRLNVKVLHCLTKFHYHG